MKKTVCSSLILASLLQSFSPVFAMAEDDSVPAAARTAAAHRQEQDPTKYAEFNMAQRNCVAAMKFLLNDLFFGDNTQGVISCRNLLDNTLFEHIMFLNYNPDTQKIGSGGANNSWENLKGQFNETLLKIMTLRVNSFSDIFSQEGLTEFPNHEAITRKGEIFWEESVRGSVVGIQRSLTALMNAIPVTEESSYAAFNRFISLIPNVREELLRFEELSRGWEFSSLLQTAGFFVSGIQYSESDQNAIQSYAQTRQTISTTMSADFPMMDSFIEEKQTAFAPLREIEEEPLRQRQAEEAARLEELARLDRDRQAAEEAERMRQIEKRRVQRLRKQAARTAELSAITQRVADVIVSIDAQLAGVVVEAAESIMGLGTAVNPGRAPILAQLRGVIGQLFDFNKIAGFTNDLATVKLTPLTATDWLMSLARQRVIDPMATVKEEFDAHRERDVSFVGQCASVLVRANITHSSAGLPYLSFYDSHTRYRMGEIGIQEFSERILHAGLSEVHRNRLLLPLSLIQTVYKTLDARPDFSSRGREQLQSLVAKAFIYTTAEAAACAAGAYGREYLMTRDLLEFLSHDNVTGLGAFDA